MKTSGFYSIGQRGFTLVEIIITLVLSAILGTILVQLGGTALTKSSSTVLNAMDEVSAQRVMEEVVADYEKKIKDSVNGFKDFKDNNNYDTGNQVDVEKQYVFFLDGKIIPQDDPSDTIMVTVSSGGHTLRALFFTKTPTEK